MPVVRCVDIVICSEQWATSRAADRNTVISSFIQEVGPTQSARKGGLV